MTAGSPQRAGAEAFTVPDQVNQRRYEALRACYVEGLTYAEAGDRFGYTRWAMIDLVRRVPGREAGPVRPAPQTRPAAGHRAGQGPRPRPGDRAAPRRDCPATRSPPGWPPSSTPLNRTASPRSCSEEGFGRLLRHPEPEASINPATPGRDTRLPAARVTGLGHLAGPGRHRPGRAAARCCPTWSPWTCPTWSDAAGYPGTRVIPAIRWLLTLLALKLTRTRRVSHVDDLLADPAAALLAGLAVLPKKSALTSYSYRLAHDHQQRFLAALDTTMIEHGLASSDEAIFDLDFHAVMHWGPDPVLEKHYVPTRSQRARSVLTFFAQDTGTHNLVYANADISKATQAREVIAFCDHWKRRQRARPGHADHGPEGHHPPRARRTRPARRQVPHPADALTRR